MRLYTQITKMAQKPDGFYYSSRRILYRGMSGFGQLECNPRRRAVFNGEVKIKRKNLGSS